MTGYFFNIFKQRTAQACLLMCFFSMGGNAHNTSETQVQRIAVAGGSITEIIYRLGEQHRIVGVDSTSVFPEEAKNKPLIGYVRRVATEGILSLEPDLFLGEADTGPLKVIQQLQRMGLNMYLFEQQDNLAGIEDKITKIAQLLKVEKKGQALVEEIQPDRLALQHILTQATYQPRVLFILTARSGQTIAAGQGTSANEIIQAAGGINVTGSLKNWQPISAEVALQLNPEVILTMGARGTANAEKVKNMPHFKHSIAVKNNQVFSLDGGYLLGMGPRTPQAVVEVAMIFHSQAKLPEHYSLRYASTNQTPAVIAKQNKGD